MEQECHKYMENFHKLLLDAILDNLTNTLDNNFDFEIGKKTWGQKIQLCIEKSINNILSKFHRKIRLSFLLENYFWNNVNLFEKIYDQLEDDDSKKCLIELLSYNILGSNKIKLKLNNSKFWALRKKTEAYIKKDRIPVNFRDGYLSLYDLKNEGFDLSLFFVPNGIATTFLLQQYRYKDAVKVVPGDVVIDAGGCWGDSALYFAAMGSRKIYSFEFVPSNIAIMEKNLALNNRYKENIEIINKPIWSESGKKISYIDKGPSSKVGDYDQFPGKTETLSIDDLVEQKKIEKIDFIKMDIEGAEIPALKGASETIYKSKPKLAISVYHKNDDLVEIPKLIKSINSGYKFYLDYYTIIGQEIILYAI